MISRLVLCYNLQLIQYSIFMASCFYLLVRDVSVEINDRGLIFNINLNVGDDDKNVIDEQNKEISLGISSMSLNFKSNAETTLRHNEQ